MSSGAVLCFLDCEGINTFVMCDLFLSLEGGLLPSQGKEAEAAA